MQIEFAYEKLMKENNLSVNELPKDAVIGIKSITDISKAIAMRERTGKKVHSGIVEKLRANDKWVTREILEHLDGKERNNTDEVPNDAKEVIQEIKADTTTDSKTNTNTKTTENVVLSEAGKKIDVELSSLEKSGKTLLTLDELKDFACKTYDTIFDSYNEAEENGVETTNFRIVETEKGSKTFNLTKI